MKFNFKLANIRTSYIFFFFLALLKIYFSTGNVHAKNFDINNVEISTPFEISFKKEEIIDKGFIAAFDRLMSSIVKSDDKELVSQIPLNNIKSMINTFSIKQEKFINEIYYVSLDVSFNKKKIFKLLESKNIFPSLPNKKKIFFIPIIINENKDELLLFSESLIFKNWNNDNKEHYLLEYILPTSDLDDLNLIKSNYDLIENYDFNEIINKYALKNFIIAIIFNKESEIRVLSKINFNKGLIINNQIYQNIDLADKDSILKLTNKLKISYEDYWKTNNQINTSIKLPLTIAINSKDNSIISKFEESLFDLDLVYNFYIQKFDNNNIYYKIIFNGSPDIFLKTMKEKNYDFNTQNQTWTLK